MPESTVQLTHAYIVSYTSNLSKPLADFQDTWLHYTYVKNNLLTGIGVDYGLGLTFAQFYDQKSNDVMSVLILRF